MKTALATSNVARRGVIRRAYTVTQQCQIQSDTRCDQLSPTNSFQYSQSRNKSIWSMLSPKRRKDSKNAEEKETSDASGKISMPSRQDKQHSETSYDPLLIQLLECPVGSFTASHWIQGSKFVEQMVDQDDIPQAFHLIDRMVQEPDARSMLSHDLIYLAVQQWLTTYTKQQRSGKQYVHHIYPPSVVWRKIESYQQKGLPLESRTYHRVLDGTALVKSKKANSHALAETILERMWTLSKHEQPSLRPSTFSYNGVLAAWEAAAASAPQHSPMSQKLAPERALALLEELKTKHQMGWGEELMPDRNTYRRIMNLFAHKGDGDQVETLLEELFELYLEHGKEHEHLLPTSPFFSLVLYAWSKSRDPAAAERAMVILNRMLELEETQEVPGLTVTAACFNIVMVCWSRQRTKESAMQVQKLFDRLVALSEKDSNKKPIGGSYTALIQTWSWWDAKKAEEAFWAWKREGDAGNCEMRMDSKLFGMLIGAWFHTKDPNNAKRCDNLLQYALDGNLGEAWEPTVTVFNMTINAYCRSKKADSVERGEALLRQMQRCVSKKSGLDLNPTVNTYVPIIHGWTALGQVERAETLLREWFERPHVTETLAKHESSTKKRQLDTRTFNHVLKAWLSKAIIFPHAASRAEDLLLNMPSWNIKPNIASFQYVLDCRKRSQSSNFTPQQLQELKDLPNQGAPRAHEVLGLLDEEYRKGRLRTTNESYLTVRQGWSLLTISDR